MKIILTQMQAEVMLEKHIAEKLDLKYVDITIENIPTAEEITNLKEHISELENRIVGLTLTKKIHPLDL